MIENDVEKYLNRKVKAAGGLSRKYTSPGRRGVPDRIVIMNGHVYFIELKRPGGKPRPDQVMERKAMNDQGIVVYVIDSKEQVDDWIKRFTS